MANVSCVSGYDSSTSYMSFPESIDSGIRPIEYNTLGFPPTGNSLYSNFASFSKGEEKSAPAGSKDEVEINSNDVVDFEPNDLQAKGLAAGGKLGMCLLNQLYFLSASRRPAEQM